MKQGEPKCGEIKDLTRSHFLRGGEKNEDQKATTYFKHIKEEIQYSYRTVEKYKLRKYTQLCILRSWWPAIKLGQKGGLAASSFFSIMNVPIRQSVLYSCKKFIRKHKITFSFSLPLTHYRNIHIAEVKHISGMRCLSFKYFQFSADFNSSLSPRV